VSEQTHFRPYWDKYVSALARLFTVEHADLLRKAAGALTNDLSASMGDIAARIGVGRSTLHRSFSSRDVLMAEVARFAMQEIERIYDLARLDEGPVLDVLKAMGDEVLNLATAYALLWADPPISDYAGMDGEWDAQRERMSAFTARGQADGSFRVDVPAIWVGFSIASHAWALGIAVRAGYLGERAVGDLFITTVLDGLGGRRADGNGPA
jgi:AcrR family transcriptional regulator